MSRIWPAHFQVTGAGIVYFPEDLYITSNTTEISKPLVCWAAEIWVNTEELFLVIYPEISEGPFPWVNSRFKTYLNGLENVIHIINKKTPPSEPHQALPTNLGLRVRSLLLVNNLLESIVFCPKSNFQTWTKSTLHKDHIFCPAARFLKHRLCPPWSRATCTGFPLWKQSNSTKWLHFPQASVYNPRFTFPKEGVLTLSINQNQLMAKLKIYSKICILT